MRYNNVLKRDNGHGGNCFCSHIMGNYERGGGFMVRVNCIPNFSGIHVTINFVTIYDYNQKMLITASMHHKG